MKIDLHTHTLERSPCSRVAEGDLIRAAIARGLDALVITDHNRLVPREHVAALNARFAPFRVFSGIEISLRSEHVLVIGVHDTLLETRTWSYAALHAFVRERGGFLALAHPFRYHPISVRLRRFPPDAVELYSHNTPRGMEQRIRRMAARIDAAVLSNSDAHDADWLGDYYNVLPDVPADEVELVAMLRSGDFTTAPV